MFPTTVRPPPRVWRIVLILACIVVGISAGQGWPRPLPASASARFLSLSVAGNQLVNGAGRPIRLLGVNRSGAEYACIGGYGILGGDVFDNPSAVDQAVEAIASWHTNAVRLALNEDCWLNINNVPAGYGGAPYQNGVVSFVNLLHRHNLFVILELHWNAPGSLLATGQQPMADADHAPAFWQSVATTFKSDSAVVFDLYNEPYGIDWNCWLNGCTSPGWQTAGMQSLVDAVRNAGATQPLMLSGLSFSNDLSQWLLYQPKDPSHALVASFHLYPSNPCNTAACWDATVAPVARQVPVVTAEFGEPDCGHGFVDSHMAWADAAGISYLGWVWDTWGCPGMALISAYDGTPTNYGVGLRDHLALVNR
jgi:hypothetical protein